MVSPSACQLWLPHPGSPLYRGTPILRHAVGHDRSVIPPKANRKLAREYGKDLHKARHLIENFFAKLKQFHAIATRYDKTVRNFFGGIHLAAAAIWLN